MFDELARLQQRGVDDAHLRRALRLRRVHAEARACWAPDALSLGSRLFETGAGPFDVRAVRKRPNAKGFEGLAERMAERRDRVFHPDRRGRQDERSHKGLSEEVATDVSIFTRAGVRRIMRFAFETARVRPRKLLTVVTKSNPQRRGMVLWDAIAGEMAKDYPDVTHDRMLVDAMTVRMVMKPQSLDTIVAANLHADILSDLAAALAGSIGIAPTANLDPERRGPSMFEPIHGSVFDITGKGVANPVGTFWSTAMMLEHIGETDAAARLMRAVERITADTALHTPDLGGPATTGDVTEAAVAAILGDNA